MTRLIPLSAGLILSWSLLLQINSLSTSSWIIQIFPYTLEYPKNAAVWNLLRLTFLCGFISNTALCMRFLEKEILKSTKICIIFSLLQGVISSILISTYSIVYPLTSNQVYSEGFYDFMLSGLFSFTVAFALWWEIKTIKDFEKKGSGVSSSQRKLLLLTMAMSAYTGFGSLIFVWLEGWTFQDAMHFSIITLTTIGFGNRTPFTLCGKLFLILYAIFGITIMACTVHAVREVFLENVHAKWKRLRHRQKSKSLNSSSSSLLVSQQFETWDLLNRQFPFAVFVTLSFWICGTLILAWTEGWTYADSMYFCFVTFTTIGYGDLIPQSSSGAAIFTIFVIVGVGVVTYLGSIVSDKVQSTWSSHLINTTPKLRSLIQHHDLTWNERNVAHIDIEGTTSRRLKSFDIKSSTSLFEANPMTLMSNNSLDNSGSNDEIRFAATLLTKHLDALLSRKGVFENYDTSAFLTAKMACEKLLEITEREKK